MRAVTWQGRTDMQVIDVPDPRIEEPTDVVVRITSTGLCGSDLHLYDPLTPFMTPGDIVGHEPMGVVDAVGADVTAVAPGDRVVVPFNISCGTCWTCERGLHSQCETTQNRDQGTGASLFGYSKLYGAVPGGQAEALRVPFGNTLPIKIPHGPSDDRFLYLSDVIPTAWQAVEYADTPDGGTLLVMGAGPIGDMCARIAKHRGLRVIVVDLVPERLARITARGGETIDTTEIDPDDVPDRVRDLTDGRGSDSVIDAVGMEAHGSPVAETAQKALRFLPKKLQELAMQHTGSDRLDALYTAFESVRRGGTVSISGVYGGAASPMPMLQLFDKQLVIRQGQANVHRWSDDILELLQRDEDVLGVEDFATHRLPLEEAPAAYKSFRDKQDGMVKVVFQP
ncbi:alcohol dehydrogenase catalytic domain-containing protein [Nocardioides rubriscoriae]|uniref:alcohol dehydrogenase catalytic domain-containing protein n=1 Tax=Nocardioides rubriscoriae TaxID=642762 RepID=UPI0011DFE345|nr:alcohol dehydrogenase catalytic domain-containing protein [Nocardioides rubriscoriae]